MKRTGIAIFRVVLTFTQQRKSGRLKIAKNHISSLCNPQAIVLRATPLGQEWHFSPIDPGTAGQLG